MDVGTMLQTVFHLDQLLEKKILYDWLQHAPVEEIQQNVYLVFTVSHYSSKCPRFRTESRSCTCRRKGCQQHHGATPQGITLKIGLKRKRDLYKTQAYPVKWRKTSRVMEKVSEYMSTGSIRFLLINSTIQYAYQDMEDWKDIDSIDHGFYCIQFWYYLQHCKGMQLHSLPH